MSPQASDVTTAHRGRPSSQGATTTPYCRDKLHFPKCPLTFLAQPEIVPTRPGLAAAPSGGMNQVRMAISASCSRPCMPGHLDTWSPGHLDTWTPGQLDTWTPRYLDTLTPGQLDTWTPRHLGIWTPGGNEVFYEAKTGQKSNQRYNLKGSYCSFNLDVKMFFQLKTFSK